MGGGLKVNFQYEIDPALSETSSRTVGTSATGTTSNVTSSLGNGQSFVELAGGFGAIKLGTPNLPTLAANGQGNSGFATAIGSGYRVTSFDAVSFQNSLRYDSPSFMGLTVGYLQSAKNDKQSLPGTLGQTGNLQNQTNGRDQATEISLTYAQGPLTVRYADLQVKQWADVALVGAATAGTQTTNKFDRKAQGISAAYYVMPKVKLMVNMVTAKNGAAHVGSGATTAANKQTKVTGLGADYEFSKLTAGYFRTETNKDDAGMRSITGYTAATGNTTYKATAVGIMHSF